MYIAKDADLLNFDNGVWVQGYYVRLNGNKHFIYTGQSDVDCGNYYPDYYPVAAKTVGQFTGLTDKNGTKIFEGDIVKDEYILGKVVYNTKQEDFDGAASFMIDDVDDGLQSYRFWNSVEVIGNIHDNPELLKGGADNG